MADTTTKPGYKTTEFWLSFGAMLLGAAYSAGFVSSGGTADKIAGLAVSLLAALGYTVNRTSLKSADPGLKTDAPVTK